jgi:cell wall-associated NlpC family hydrolase
MTVREQIVAEALTWAKTPYVDHAGVKNCGVDCAFLPVRILQAVGKIPKEYEPPKYSPQQWLNSRQQCDKRFLKFEDTTLIDIVHRFADREIEESEVLPGDFVVVKVAASWTHMGVIIHWPDYVLHPVKDRGVIGSHGTREGFWAQRPKRFFTVIPKGFE